MLRSKITILGSFLVLILGTTLLFGQTQTALLSANGDLTVNGQPAGNSMVVFSGDKVKAAASSAGSINLPGSSVVLSPNSSIQYQPASVQLLEGAARVSTSNGMSAIAGQVVVAPKDAAAKFDIVKAGNNVKVISREGALTVKEGTRTIIVPAGSSADIPYVAIAGSGPVNASPTEVPANFLASDRLSEHPFYGVVNGVETTPATLPICEDTLQCIRPSVSKLRPCCCPPIVKCSPEGQ